MKKNLIILGITLAGAVGVFAQGQATLTDKAANSIEFHIYGPNTDPSQRVSGNVSTAWSTANHAGDFPVGSAAYSGTLIGGNSSGTGQYQFSNGNAYELEVAAVQGSGPVGLGNLIPSSIENFSTTASTVGGTGNAGTFTAEVITVPGTSSTGADTAEFQIYAWYEGNSQYTSYSAAQAAGVPAGFSDPFSGTTQGPPTLPPNLVNARSFSLTSVPEPSTIALGIMGASAFLLRRRKS